MKKKSRPTDGGGNWMDTYGDMVTLLMTCCTPCLMWMPISGMFL